MKAKKEERIFLDYASATPVLPEVISAMTPFLAHQFQNPSALYKEAVEVKQMINGARKEIASVLRALPDEIVFTGSGTEADNLAILGVIENAIQSNPKPHIIISPFEHSAIREAVEKVKAKGGKVSTLPLYEDGRVKAEDVKKLLNKNTVLVSVMYANNEIGTIQPVKDIAKVIRQYKNLKPRLAGRKAGKNFPLLHTDASQAANYLNLNVLELGVDLMTLDASKVYGPKGVGLLFVKRGIELTAQIVGGGQEGGRRSGTENVSAIVGFAKALSIAAKDKEKESARLISLRDITIKNVMCIFPQMHLNGSLDFRLPNNINICIEGIDAEFTVLKLDARGFAISTSSSCEAKSNDPRSIAVEALGRKDCNTSSLRITMGRGTTSAHMKKFVSTLQKILE